MSYYNWFCLIQKDSSVNKEYPKTFVRGLSSIDYIQDGKVLPIAFQFKEMGRDDGMAESSINWVDDYDAIELALKQRKDNGKIQFQAGLAELDLERVKLFLESFSNDDFSYERRPLENNPYHGNLLVNHSLKKQMKALIANGLALAAGSNIIPQTYN